MIVKIEKSQMTINQGFAKNGYRHLIIFTHLYPKYVFTKRKWGLQKYE